VYSGSKVCVCIWGVCMYIHTPMGSVYVHTHKEGVRCVYVYRVYIGCT